MEELCTDVGGSLVIRQPAVRAWGHLTVWLSLSSWEVLTSSHVVLLQNCFVYSGSFALPGVF